MTSKNRVKSNYDDIANFSYVVFLQKIKITSYVNSEVLSLFNNIKIPSYVTPELKKNSIYYLNKCTTIHLTRKFPFWVFQRCSPAHFEYKESFGKSWVKITEWSVWLKNFHFGYLKGAHLYYGFSFYLFSAWYLHVLYICFNLGKMFCGQNLSKKREWYLRLEKFQVK